MNTKNLLLCALCCALAFACTSKPDPGSNHDTTQIAEEPVDTALSANLERDDFASKAAIGGMMEVESSAKMIKFTENPDIQTLATMMVKDHGAANVELKQIAKIEKLSLPQSLPSEKMEKLNQLSALKEDDANRFYADMMVNEHLEAVALFSTASQTETNPALKAFAAKHLPILKAHAMHAQAVKKMIQSIKNDKGDVPLKISKDRAQ